MAVVAQTDVHVDGLRSPVLEAGDASSSEAVVFVHGSPGCGGEFRDLVERTGEFARAVAPDMPGFGQADKPSPSEFRYDVPNLGVHLARMLDGLGVERAHFVGHDFGGAFSLLAAAYDPARVGSMTMINSGMMRGARWHRLARLYRTPVAGELFMRVANEAGFKRTLSDLPADALDEMWRNFDRPTRRAIIALYRNTDLAIQHEQLPMIRLMAANWPALVIFGEQDPYLPAALAARNREALPLAEVHKLPRSGHWPHLDDPNGVAELLMPFLQAQVERPVLA